MYIALIILMIFFTTIEGLLWKKNKKTPLQTLFGATFWSLIAITIVFATSLIYDDNPFRNFDWIVIGLICAQVVLIVFNVLLWVKVMQCLPLSIAEPIALFRLILISLGALWLFSASITTWQIVCIIIICISVIGIGYFQGKYKKRENADYLKGLLFLIGWVLSISALGLIIQYLLMPTFLGGRGVNPMAMNMVQILLVFSVVVGIYLIKKPKELWTTIKQSFDDKIHMGIGASGVYGRICISIIIALTGMNRGILEAIQMAAVALIVLYCVIFWKERPRLISYFFIAATIAGAVVLSLV
jgi:drug/metabolite transporter (DMT)-like permease